MLLPFCLNVNPSLAGNHQYCIWPCGEDWSSHKRNWDHCKLPGNPVWCEPLLILTAFSAIHILSKLNHPAAREKVIDPENVDLAFDLLRRKGKCAMNVAFTLILCWDADVVLPERRNRRTLDNLLSWIDSAAELQLILIVYANSCSVIYTLKIYPCENGVLCDWYKLNLLLLCLE